MTPPREPEPALAAPGIGELLATPQQSFQGPRSNRRRRNRSYSHVHLELDLAARPLDPTGIPLLERLSNFLREKQIVERGTLILMAAATLHAMASRRFRRVDHWEVSPGGWLPPPRPGHDSDDSEPVGVLLEMLEGGVWVPTGSPRSFSARLSDLSGNRVDVTVRRVHGERRHAIMLDVWGSWTRADVNNLTASLSDRLPVVRTTWTKYQYH